MRIIILFSLLILLGAGCASATSDTKSGEASSSVASNTIDLSGQGLTALPRNIFVRKNTTEFDVSNNQLTGALPAEIGRLVMLKVLNASRNNMTGVPVEVGQLSRLETLDLSYNSLTGLPYEIGNLSNLKVLDLRGNDISSVDIEVIRAALPSTTSIFVDEGR